MSDLIHVAGPMSQTAPARSRTNRGPMRAKPLTVNCKGARALTGLWHFDAERIGRCRKDP